MFSPFLVGMGLQWHRIGEHFFNVCLHQRKIVVLFFGYVFLLVGAFFYVGTSVPKFNVQIFQPERLVPDAELCQDVSDGFINVLCL